MRYITLNGVKTRYISAGHGERHILLLHGWASSARMWLRTMWQLRHEYRLWAVDLPGHGYTETPGVRWQSVSNYTQHITQLIQQFGIERLSAVIGHSMGGRITLELTHQYPDLVERMVLVSPSVTGKLGFSLDHLINDRLSFLEKPAQKAWGFATQPGLSQLWPPRFLGKEAMRRTAQDLEKTYWPTAYDSIVALTRTDTRPFLADLNQPTLIICGKRDFTLPPSDSEIAANYLPNAQLVMMRGVHHWPPDEDEQTYLTHLTSFLADILKS